MSRRLLMVGLFVLGLVGQGPIVCPAEAQERIAVPAPVPGGEVVVRTPTLGGVQFWADELFFRDWRIQRNAVTGHCRLLDENDLRYAWGTYEECVAALEEVKRRENLPPMRGKAVVLLHGLSHSRRAMVGLAKYLEEQGGYTIVSVGYPSTRQCVADYARSLGNVLQNLPGIEETNFVAHSMGNIVIRRYMADQADPAAGRRPDPRIKRFVMLGPPNQGSIIANALADNPVFAAVLGTPGQELGRRWPWLEESLATPSCEFGIIAGGLGNDEGFNPLLPGDDDGLVTVASTRLDRARDFVLVPVLHMALMNDRRVQQYTLNFLKTGRFKENDQ